MFAEQEMQGVSRAAYGRDEKNQKAGILVRWDGTHLVWAPVQIPVKLLPHSAVITLQGAFPISPPQCSCPGRLGVVKLDKAEGRAGRKMTPW